VTGRFFRGPIPWDAYGEHLEFVPPDGIEPPEPRYNIPPMSWVPKWTSFTAQSETIDEAPTFRGAYRYRRCLIPASGYFVWSGETSKRIPTAIGVTEQPWFCFAGVWETWGHDGGEIDTFAILTTKANDLVGAYSTRMPVILRPRDYITWLDPPGKNTKRLFRPFPAEDMEEWPVDPAVGNVSNQGSELIAR